MAAARHGPTNPTEFRRRVADTPKIDSSFDIFPQFAGNGDLSAALEPFASSRGGALANWLDSKIPPAVAADPFGLREGVQARATAATLRPAVCYV